MRFVVSLARSQQEQAVSSPARKLRGPVVQSYPMSGEILSEVAILARLPAANTQKI